MKKLFSHENRLIVFNIKNLLEEQGIVCQLKNEFAAGGVGELAPFETWPELWVESDADFERAETLIKQLEHAADVETSCPNCEELNVSSFKICWHCGHTLD